MREGIEADLLSSVAEQLKVPLSVIARQAELAQIGAKAGAEFEPIGAAANAALSLVDSYLLGLRLIREQGRLPLEPVSVPMVLCDVAHELQCYGKAYGVDLDLQARSRCVPAMAHREGLRAALLSVGFEIIEAHTQQTDGSRTRLVLEAHPTTRGIATGMYGAQPRMSLGEWRKSRHLAGRARQPVAKLAPGSGAGLFVADVILQAMFSGLRPSKYRSEYGVSALLMPSQQLTFALS